jgi:hypothetical protein
VYIAAMRLPDVVLKVATKLKYIAASFELMNNELVVYTWPGIDLNRIFSTINSVVEES